MTRRPASVRIVEVGPRDGLQNEKAVVPLAAKVGLIDLLSATGLKTIEAGAFVSPKWVPQMADSAEVMARIARAPDITYPVLVPNDTGLDAALAAGATEVAVFGAASESFSRRNINCSIAESLARFAPVVARARAAGLTVRGYVSCVLGCPYEGEVPAEKVAEVSAALFGLGCYEVSLGDTIGIGTPSKAVAMIDAVSARIPRDSLAVHFHDTYGMAVANIHAALDRGIAVVDSAVAGLGGCPYAKGATGNVATEDVLYLLDGLGIASGVAMDRLLDATRFISGVLDRPPASKVARALIARGGDSDA
ncbi:MULTISPECIES: hydroxymethylglutaryl-CoA lyase [unclassified Inquilinus]|uniref:hydroxymethylglutaryl-CoA lyase n=1 Tax=unclassified Inquilinus TaxID=2645927 RepID=UPI003F91016B